MKKNDRVLLKETVGEYKAGHQGILENVNSVADTATVSLDTNPKGEFLNHAIPLPAQPLSKFILLVTN